MSPTPASSTPTSPETAEQIAFDDLSRPLSDVTFVVVDLETTGGSAKDCHITEIGAVKTRGGEILGEFQTLVNPGVAIPPFIASLTGISNAMLTTAPNLAAALPMFLDFAQDSVLVAHNAGFDMSFLKAACKELDYPWPRPQVVDTARLARVLLHRDEVPNNKLGSLARFFHATVTPNHRALADAQATVDVLHGLIERAAGFGAHHLEDLGQLSSSVTPDQRAKRTLADDLPRSPGVYVFRDQNGDPLYVGKSKNIRNRVRTYFTASEKRKRMTEMVRIAKSVTPIPCATDLEAQVREVRLIAEYRPPYNRRSRSPEKAKYLKLTAEPAPRLSIVNQARSDDTSGATYVGPFSSKRVAEQARDAALMVMPLRTCTTRLSRTKTSSDCVAAELGSCLAPCVRPEVWDDYEALAEETRHALTQDSRRFFDGISAHMAAAAGAEDFERASAHREHLRTLLNGIHTAQTSRFLGRCELLVAARPIEGGQSWELHVIKHGRLAGAAPLDTRGDVQAQVDAAVATSAEVSAPTDNPTAAIPEESRLILNWLTSPDVRLARLSEPFSEPLGSAAKYLSGLPKPEHGSRLQVERYEANRTGSPESTSPKTRDRSRRTARNTRPARTGPVQSRSRLATP